jgi:FkbM family methyltransferase
MKLRQIAEILLRRFSVNRRIKIADRSIDLRLSLASQLKYLKKDFDDDIKDVARRFTEDSDLIFDIGANCGVFSAACLISAHSVRVVAVEPDPVTFKVLESNLRDYNSIVINKAVSDTAGTAELLIPNRGRATSTIVTVGSSTQMGGIRSAIRVETTTVDDLVAEYGPPALIKVDVEGAEALVIRGAEKTLTEHSPILHIEVSPVNMRLVELIISLGYRCVGQQGKNFTFLPLRKK